ncbi:MAG: hypothetical protein RLZZ595_852 [Bacteroidota bacterium]|jgi:hypothetical protein
MKLSISFSKIFLLLCLLFSQLVHLSAQETNNKPPIPTPVVKPSKTDTLPKKRSVASKAALRSAILPGLGQAYNKKYWKIPIVYGVIAIPVSLFNYNSKWYSKTRTAYTIRSTNDSANFGKIAPELIPLSNESLRLYRNDFRKNMDFSILGILVAWGLNIVDATVDGHLRGFDISDEVSLKVGPKFSSGNGLGQMGISATFHFGKNKQNKTVGL